MKLWVAGVVTASVLSMPHDLRGQTSSLFGQVRDTSGAAAIVARVTAIDTDTGTRRVAAANEQGYYFMPSLQPGNYKIYVECSGFQTIVRDGLTLGVGQNGRLDFQLRIDTRQETVIVRSDAELVNTVDSSVSRLITHDEVGSMPLNGRTLQSLISLAPGVVLTTASDPSPGQFSADGQRTYSNYFIVDGVSANVGVSFLGAASAFSGSQPALTVQGRTQGLVSVDALEEARIQTSNYLPEYGRAPGAQIEFQTRSGTKQLHGSVFEYFRNNALDANDWFANSQAQSRQELRLNDFGGTLGGPLFNSGNGHSRGTYFFFSYEGSRLRQPEVVVSAVPSTSIRKVVPSSVQPLLNAFPKPTGPELIDPYTNRPNGYAQFIDHHSDPSTTDGFSLRVDHHISEAFSLFARYANTPSSSTTRVLSNQLFQTRNTQTITIAALMHISKNSINDLRGNFSRAESAGQYTLDRFGGALVPADTAVFPVGILPKDASIFYYFPRFGSGYALGGEVSNQQRQVNVVDSLSFLKQSHSLKFGLDYRRIFPSIGNTPVGEALSFSNLSDLISGTVSFANIAWSSPVEEPVFINWSVYAQDTWHIWPRFTMSYGVRWDVNPAPHNARGPDPDVLSNLGTPESFSLAPSGTPVYPTQYRNFAPRAGIAYELLTHSGWETVMRSGAGVYYDVGSSYASWAFGNPPLSTGIDVAQVPFPLRFSSSPPASALAPPYGYFAAYRDFHAPYLAQWDLALEQSIGRQQIITASYVGSVGRHHLGFSSFANPNPQFLRVDIFSTDKTSDYHALQLQFRRRMSHSFQLSAIYDWAHAIDEISDASGAVIMIAPGRSNSDFDVRHQFSSSLSYQLPAFLQSHVVHTLFSGWTVDAITRAQTALPVDLIAGFGVFGHHQVLTRPDLIPGQPLYLHDSQVAGRRRFNSAAFSAPPLDPTTFLSSRPGTLGRNVLRGLPWYQIDFALRRHFTAGEHLMAEISGEAFNVLNHPNFGNIDNSVGDPNLGVPQSMLNQSLGGLSPIFQQGGPRSVQIALRLSF